MNTGRPLMEVLNLKTEREGFMIVGIDPGRTGGLVLMDGFKPVRWWRGGQLRAKGDTELSDRLALDALRECMAIDGGVVLVVLEKQWAGWRGGKGQNQGVKSQAQIVGEYRAWRAMCVALGLRVMTPAPVTWQAVLKGAGGKGKERAIRLVQQMIPDLDLTLNAATGRKTKPHDGLADAAAMCLFAKEKYHF